MIDMKDKEIKDMNNNSIEDMNNMDDVKNMEDVRDMENLNDAENTNDAGNMNEAENINDMKDAEEMKEKEDKKARKDKPPRKPVFNKRSLRFGSYSFVLTVIVIAAAIILNAIVGATQIREFLKIDLTSNKLYSLSEKTDEVLKELNEKVEIIGLFDESKMSDSSYSQVIEFIKQYETKSSLIDVRYVDPEKNPAYIQNELDPEGLLGVSKYDFVVRSSKRSKVLSTYDIFDITYNSSYIPQVTGLNAEYAFTGAIRYVTSDDIPAVYYTEGHGEGDLEKEYSELVSSLELNGYEVKKINLASVEQIPEDASIVLFASPKWDLTTPELDKLYQYMENGGNTVFLFDPPETNVRLTNFEEFLSRYNIALGYDVIFEMAANRAAYGQPYYFMPTVENNSINSVLEPSKFNLTLVYAQSIEILKNEKEWISSTPLLTTSSEAIGKALFEGEEDNTGPLNIAVAVENSGYTRKSKTVVIGNSTFVSDRGMSISDTGKKFLVNSINWMQEKEADIYIPVKKYSIPRIQNVTQQTLTILFIGLIIVVPLIIMGAGVFVWLRRRHL